MLFLVLFATLAVGFYASTTMNTQIARNDRDTFSAQSAAESGLRFIRLEIARAQATGATFDDIADAVTARLSRTANLGANGVTRTLDAQGREVAIIPGTTGTPAAYTWMSLGPAGACRFVLTDGGAQGVHVKAVGRGANNATTERGVQVSYKAVAQAWVAGSAGLLARGPISMTNGAQISGGDIFSAAPSGTVPLTMSGGAKIDQNFLYAANTKAPAISNGARVQGDIIPNATASFPQVDVTPFAQYVPDASATGPKVITATTSIPSTATLTNIRIKANANTSFGNSQTLNGVIYIESPNQITFGGGMRINGVIVTDNNGAANNTSSVITIANGVRIDTLATLDASAFPASERIAELKQLSGALVLAPNFKVVLAGGARSYGGAFVANEFDVSNGYRGTITNGMVSLSTKPFMMMGGGQLTFNGGGTAVPGLIGGSSFRPAPRTYLEVAP